MAFDHEKLDVYQLAIEFVAKANEIVAHLPRGRGYLGDQLQRAALSIVLNIAEGAGKFSPADKAAVYARSRGSVTESAAVLDVCLKLCACGRESGERKQATTRAPVANAHEAGESTKRPRMSLSYSVNVNAPEPAPGFFLELRGSTELSDTNH